MKRIGVRPRASFGLLLFGALAGCAARAPSGADGPERPEPGVANGEAAPEPVEGARAPEPARDVRAESAVGALPPIPGRVGPLDIYVQYPRPNQRIAVRDTNFIFGNVGTGDAVLEIDGEPVRVEPNGAFLAWLPVPPGSPGDTAEYVLVARRGAEADTLVHPVRLPSTPFEAAAGTVEIDPESLPSEVERWLGPDDPFEFRVRASPGLDVSLEVADRVLALRERGVAGTYSAIIRPGELVLAACMASFDATGSDATAGGPGRAATASGGAALAAGRSPTGYGSAATDAACFIPARTDTLEVRVVASDGRERVVETRLYPFGVVDPDALPLVMLEEAPEPVHGLSGLVAGSPTPYGFYDWLFPAGTRATVARRLGDRVQVRLAPDEGAWVVAEDAQLVEERLEGAPAGARGPISIADGREAVEIRVPLTMPVPTLVEETDAYTLRITLYGVAGVDGIFQAGHEVMGEPALPGELVEDLSWEAAAGGRTVLSVRLREPTWGYRLSYPDPDRDPAVLLLEVRRPPRIDESQPLRGRRIAVDAGHPPVGAYGPTGFYEGDANLAIARRLAALLREAGAEPVLVRGDTLPMGLYDRTNQAAAAGAEIFVSIHNNALPDGVRPFGEEGTSTYFFYPHSEELAHAVQAGMLRTMGLRDLGVMRGNFAVARTSWMPSVLAEGAFMMIPRHEAALRTPEFQRRYAEGVLLGIERFLAERGNGQDRE